MARKPKIAKDAKITVVFFKDQELMNNLEFPLTGWLYPKGASLKGVTPTTYETMEELKETIEGYRGVETKLYFNLVPENNAVMEF